LQARESELLPVPYFHLVFTLPAALGPLAPQNPRVVYGLLLQAAAQTLLEVAANSKHLGAEVGFLTVLHTWGQNLLHHPHVHCVIPAGGLAPDGARWIHCRPEFFLPVRVLSRVFRGKFIGGLKRAFARGDLAFHGELAELAQVEPFERLLDQVVRRDWVVYAKPPFGGPAKVLAYLGRYTHRVAIANSRLVAMTDGKVTFCWRDYRHHGKTKLMMLPADEFIRRFLLHALPDGLHRIRHYGFLANGQRAARLALCRQLLVATAPATTALHAEPAIDAAMPARPCPCCGGPMVTLVVWHYGQAPPRRAAWNDSS
jgi:hypothetical protein